VKVGGIYKIRNTISDECYVGSAEYFKKRWWNHVHYLDRNEHHSPHLQRAWNKYGKNTFIFEVVEVVDNIKFLIEREQFWIGQLNPQYNVLKKAGSSKGFKHTEETKKKLSELNKGAGNPRYGYRAPKKTPIKTKKSTSRYIKKGRRGKPILRISDNGEVKEYNSIILAALDNNSTHHGGISHVLGGRRNKWRGFFWKYKDV